MGWAVMTVVLVLAGTSGAVLARTGDHPRKSRTLLSGVGFICLGFACLTGTLSVGSDGGGPTGLIAAFGFGMTLIGLAQVGPALFGRAEGSKPES